MGCALGLRAGGPNFHAGVPLGRHQPSPKLQRMGVQQLGSELTPVVLGAVLLFFPFVRSFLRILIVEVQQCVPLRIYPSAISNSSMLPWNDQWFRVYHAVRPSCWDERPTPEYV